MATVSLRSLSACGHVRAEVQDALVCSGADSADVVRNLFDGSEQACPEIAVEAGGDAGDVAAILHFWRQCGALAHRISSVRARFTALDVGAPLPASKTMHKSANV